MVPSGARSLGHHRRPRTRFAAHGNAGRCTPPAARDSSSPSPALRAAARGPLLQPRPSRGATSAGLAVTRDSGPVHRASSSRCFRTVFAPSPECRLQRCPAHGTAPRLPDGTPMRDSAGTGPYIFVIRADRPGVRIVAVIPTRPPMLIVTYALPNKAGALFNDWSYPDHGNGFDAVARPHEPTCASSAELSSCVASPQSAWAVFSPPPVGRLAPIVPHQTIPANHSRRATPSPDSALSAAVNRRVGSVVAPASARGGLAKRPAKNNRALAMSRVKRSPAPHRKSPPPVPESLRPPRNT